MQSKPNFPEFPMRPFLMLACALALAGCGEGPVTTNEISAEIPIEGDTAGEEGKGSETTETENTASENAPPSEAEPVDSEALTLTGTAWRVTGEDGAIYTTFLDPDGSYRDMKNGDPWAQGTWERLADGRLCFTPADEERSGDCWEFGSEDREGNLRVTNDDGHEVELRPVTYIAPEDEA
jgi:hypothetical protein